MRNPDPETAARDDARSDPPPARADARRNHDAVVAAALRLLIDDPDASVAAIADASGLTRTTVYRHFPTRDALLRAVCVRVHGEILALGASIVDARDPVPATLRRFAREIVANSVRYRFLTAHRGLIEEVVDDERVIERDPVLAWLRGAHARGELRSGTSPEWQFRMLRSLVTAACSEVLAGRADAARAGELLGETLVDAFAAP